MKTSVHLKLNLFFLIATSLIALAASAQTYTTQAAGNWSSPSTWVGGQVPNRTIATGSVVHIKHRVTADLGGDLVINGTLNIVGDTLVFASAFNKNTVIAATGLLYIQNGGYKQDITARRCEMTVNGGRVMVKSGLLQVGKTYLANAGSRRSYTANSTVQVGEGYEAIGTSASRVTDTIQASTLEVGLSNASSLLLKDYATLRVANARIRVASGNFLNETNASISVLTGAVSNYGFNLLRTSGDLENKGAWDARIDQLCVGGTIKGSAMAAIDITRSQDCSVPTTGPGATAPELIFRNPVLVQGQANKQGAIYRFANITSGIDAEVKLAKFSRNDIVMQSIDLSGIGWDKAFQPQFGLPGLVAPWQNWYIDFEMTFFKAGTNQKQKLSKVDMTALDVDGDGLSISEYAVFESPSNIIYSTVSYLTNQTAGLVGQTFPCSIDNLPTLLIHCVACGGDGKGGIWNIDECTICDASGLVHAGCLHAFEGINGATVTGPVENFTNIDTLATQVMATYQYVDRDRIKFRYGARSTAQYSNGAGVRLNSLWFRQFSMAPPTTLPVRLNQFTANYDRKNVLLEWNGLEENFSHYVLQRSTDGREYRDFAVIFTAGNGPQQTYRYRDPNVSSSTGNVFYRLQMVDLTKESAFSEIKMVRLNAGTDALVLASFPNPVQNELRITLPSALQGKAVIMEVHNMNGTPVLQKYYGQTGQTESLNVSSLPKGSYVIRAISGDLQARQVIIKN